MIVRVGQIAAESATVVIPTGHQAGDLLLVFAFRDGSVTNPSLPVGWTNLLTPDGTSCSVRVAYRIAASSAESNAVFTNATATICHVYRSVKSDGVPVGTPVAAAGTTSPSTYSAVTQKGTTSWFAAFQGHRSVDTTTLTNPPTGMALAASNLGATCDVASFDTGRSYSGSYPSNTVAPGGTASGWQTVVIEIRTAEFLLNNYQFPRVGDGMATTERIR
ncbi:MAG: hypothetical protein AB1428_13160 [Bacteroidota bacterium]